MLPPRIPLTEPGVCVVDAITGAKGVTVQDPTGLGVYNEHGDFDGPTDEYGEVPGSDWRIDLTQHQGFSFALRRYWTRGLGADGPCLPSLEAGVVFWWFAHWAVGQTNDGERAALARLTRDDS